jgi:hypothetical protein
MIYLFVAGSHSVVKSWQVSDINDFIFLPRKRTVGASAKIVKSE